MVEQWHRAGCELPCRLLALQTTSDDLLLFAGAERKSLMPSCSLVRVFQSAVPDAFSCLVNGTLNVAAAVTTSLPPQQLPSALSGSD